MKAGKTKQGKDWIDERMDWLSNEWGKDGMDWNELNIYQINQLNNQRTDQLIKELNMSLASWLSYYLTNYQNH